MKFRTEIILPPSEFSISHQDKIMMVGSCFVENISAKLLNSGFRVDVNPAGVMYNPVSVSKVLNDLIERREYTIQNLYPLNDIYHSFSHHGRFSGTDPNRVIDTINSRIEESSGFLQEADYLFITWGTSYVYYLESDNISVANCHKFPSKMFYRKKLTPEEIEDQWNRLITSLRVINPDLKIIFTISPIRHWKDGASENQVSKSILFVALDQLMEKNDKVYYFPSYELLMDDLRDYRFYMEDMLHPNFQALDYIWGKFSYSYFNKQTKLLIKEWEDIQAALSHRPFNPESEEYKFFSEQTKKRKQQFIEKNKWNKDEID